MKKIPPIDADVLMNRFYIPIHPDWEIQTKGNGSSFRIVERKENGKRYLVGDTYLHDPIEAIARAIHANTIALEQEIEARQAEIDRLMLEFCPEEMTPEQIENWKKRQKPASE